MTSSSKLKNTKYLGYDFNRGLTYSGQTYSKITCIIYEHAILRNSSLHFDPPRFPLSSCAPDLYFRTASDMIQTECYSTETYVNSVILILKLNLTSMRNIYIKRCVVLNEDHCYIRELVLYADH